MAKYDSKQLCEIIEQLFAQQAPVLSLWQTIADNFYPERADFTRTRSMGDELGAGLMDSYPVIARRDLGNSIQSMLRDGHWFDMAADKDVGPAADSWMERATKKLYDLMHNRTSNFVRSAREGDHDYISFGQCVISVEVNRLRTGLLYRCWHLRDCAWWEDSDGSVAGVVRKWTPTLRDMMITFGDKCHRTVMENYTKKPFDTIQMRHIVMPSGMYGDEEISAVYPYVSIYIDTTHQHVIEAVGLHHQHYVVPRFFTLSGQPYAVSPATIAALPNSRLLQSMTFTLMEAGERIVRPPLVAQHGIFRGDVDLSSNGITFIDSEYDERLGEGLRPLVTNGGGLPFGMDMKRDVIALISSAFYLDKLGLPARNAEMTAYEVQERMKQYRREALPLISPIETEYSAQLCEISFDVAMNAGFFGRPETIPGELQGQDVRFKFKSPITDSEQDEKLNRYESLLALAERTAALDKQVLDIPDFDTAFRDACDGGSMPVDWLNSEKVTMKLRQAQAQAVQAGGAPGVEINE